LLGHRRYPRARLITSCVCAAAPVWRGSGATTKTRVPLLALGLGFSPLQASLLGPPRAM